MLVVCLDSLAQTSGPLYVYDSAKSAKSSTRDLFVNKLKAITQVTEQGVLSNSADFTPFEHLVYADKGVSAITITTTDKPYGNVY